MAPPYDPGDLVCSLVRVPGSGRDDPKASILCDLSLVSTLAATFPIPRNLPPALVSSPSRLPDNNIQNPHLRGHNPTVHIRNYSSDPRKRTRDQVFRGNESSKSKVSKLGDTPLSPRHAVNVGGANVTSSNRGSTITPAVVVLIPRNHMHPFISTSQPQEGRTPTPQVLITQLQDSPASLGVVTQLQGLLQQSNPPFQRVMAHLQSLFHHARPAPQGVVVQVQSLLQQVANPASQSTPVPQIVVAPEQSRLQPTNPSPQKVVVPHQSYLQPTPQVVFHHYLQQTNQSPNNIKIQHPIKQLEPNISKQNVGDAMSMTEVTEEVRQLREDNGILRRQVSLFQQLFRDKQRLLSVIRTLGVLEKPSYGWCKMA